MPFVSMTIDLRHAPVQKISLCDSRFAHAAVMNALTLQQPITGKKLHDSQASKPVTLALFPQTSTRTNLRMTFISDTGIEYANSLVTALTQTQIIQLGQLRCDIFNFDLNTPPWGVIETWENLVTDMPENKVFTIDFITPTAINKSDCNKNRYSWLLPDPITVFSGLAKKWKDFSGPSLPENLRSFLESGGCRISYYRVETIAEDIKTHKQIGFIGRVSYECSHQDEDCANAIISLARFAFFGGVGYHTAQGMGAVLSRIG